jgi:DNA-binding transcriptional LysR family regulator
LTTAVLRHQIDAAFVAEAPANGLGTCSLPLFAERLVLITPLGHASVRSPRDVAGTSVIAFPSGCAYRRVLERWLGAKHLAVARVLELGSYHAIVACVSAGAGIALIPESVLQTLPGAEVQRHGLREVHRDVVTPLIWRAGEASSSVVALRELAAGMRKANRHEPIGECQATRSRSHIQRRALLPVIHNVQRNKSR